MGNSPVFWLDLLISGETAHRFALFSGEHTIGRSRDCTIQLLDSTVSSHHATITVRENPDLASFYELSLTDLHSTNGSWINGRRIENERIAVGDIIGFGSTRLKINDAANTDTDLTSYDLNAP